MRIRALHLLTFPQSHKKYVVPRPNGTQAIKVTENNLGKLDDDDTYICAFNIGTNNPPKPYFPQSGGHFELVPQQRFGGPITIRLADYSLTTAFLAMSTITSATTSTEALITAI